MNIKKQNQKNIIPNNSKILLYKTADDQIKLNVIFDNDTVWLTQKQMSELFDVETNTINYHIKEVFKVNELEENSTIRKIRIVQKEGSREVKRNVEFYNLDMIISVGYRVNSTKATQFRIWATKTLREFIIKGFVLDDDRLKNPDHPFDYYDELLERIQEIRTSERRFYQKITDIYATSIDYDPTLEISIDFFKTVQNKMHWAITGQTAAEIIHKRANSKKANMGLTSWRSGKIKKADTAIAKNYLNQKELKALNNLVEQYLVFATGQAMRRIAMTMKDWIKKLDGFLSLNDRNILTHKGLVSHEQAIELAEEEYKKFKIQEDKNYISDFDKSVQKYLKEKK